jgi:hypothetical protein
MAEAERILVKLVNKLKNSWLRIVIKWWNIETLQNSNVQFIILKFINNKIYKVFYPEKLMIRSFNSEITYFSKPKNYCSCD